MPTQLEFTATEVNRLDKFLGSQCSEISRARFQKLIADGHVSVDGVLQHDSGLKLKPGQLVVVLMPEATAPEPQG